MVCQISTCVLALLHMGQYTGGTLHAPVWGLFSQSRVYSPISRWWIVVSLPFLDSPGTIADFVPSSSSLRRRQVPWVMLFGRFLRPEIDWPYVSSEQKKLGSWKWADVHGSLQGLVFPNLVRIVCILSQLWYVKVVLVFYYGSVYMSIFALI